MIGKNGGNFLTAHYEWIAALVAAVVLVWGGMLFVGALGTDADALADEKIAEIKRTAPGGEKVLPADLADFTRATKVAKAPTSLGDVTDDKGSYLASERRVFCGNPKCHAALPGSTRTCPRCNFEFKEEVKVVLDGDNDGMPDAWEKKHGLNPNNPADAALDRDADGFTNLEEYEAKTDPTDRNDHPDYLASLAVQLPLKKTVLPFHFTGAYKTPSGMKFQFKDPSRTQEYDRGVYSLLAGEEIGKTGFAPEKIVEKKVEKTIGGGMKSTSTVPEAIVVRKSDGKSVSMAVNQIGVPVDVQARLVYTRGGQKTFDVVAGDAIDLNGTKYIVKDIKGTENGAKVTLAAEKTGKESTLSAP